MAASPAAMLEIAGELGRLGEGGLAGLEEDKPLLADQHRADERTGLFQNLFQSSRDRGCVDGRCQGQVGIVIIAITGVPADFRYQAVWRIAGVLCDRRPYDRAQRDVALMD